MHLISGITDEWQGCDPPPPAKLNAKAGPLASFIVVFTILLVSVDCFRGDCPLRGDSIHFGNH